jgi:hypothetical protein
MNGESTLEDRRAVRLVLLRNQYGNRSKLAVASTKWCRRMHNIRICSIGPSVLGSTKRSLISAISPQSGHAVNE